MTGIFPYFTVVLDRVDGPPARLAEALGGLAGLGREEVLAALTATPPRLPVMLDAGRAAALLETVRWAGAEGHVALAADERYLKARGRIVHSMNEDHRLWVEVFRLPGGEALLRAGGYVDASTYRFLEAAVREVVEGEDPRLLVDLSRIDYLSSTGAGVLVSGRTLAVQRGGALGVGACNPPVGEVLRVLGLESLLLA
ncbi:MAG: STAS domain-containing protein [Planctomycetes bacterium]|nr:STAS domain-containing protein [Planctomycetota bacterium]